VKGEPDAWSYASDEEEQELVMFRSGTSKISVYRSEYAGTNKATAGSAPVISVNPGAPQV